MQVGILKPKEKIQLVNLSCQGQNQAKSPETEKAEKRHELRLDHKFKDETIQPNSPYSLQMGHVWFSVFCSSYHSLVIHLPRFIQLQYQSRFYRCFGFGPMT